MTLKSRRTITCPVCHRKYTGRDYHECPECPAMFDSLPCEIDHAVTVHGMREKSHACPKCGPRGTDVRVRAIKGELHDRHFTCEVCGSMWTAKAPPADV